MRTLGGFARLLAAFGLALAVAGGVMAVSLVTTVSPASTGLSASARASVAISTVAATVQAPRWGNPGGGAAVPPAARAVNTSHPNHVIGAGRPTECTSAAVVKAVAEGGIITFDCGPKPVTINMRASAKVVNTHRETVLDGGGKVTLNGMGKVRILYQNTCDKKQVWTTGDCWQQQWPLLVVQNLTFADAYSGVRQTSTSAYGGGAIFAEGGQLKVVNSGFVDNSCFKTGPDLGGAAVRALGMYRSRPVYLTSDTFRGGKCSNGGALSSIDASWDVFNSFFTKNKTTGWGENPKASGTPGGGSGGAIYTDGDNYNVLIDGTIIRDNTAGKGEGGAVFFVVDSGSGRLTIEHSTLHHNPSGGYVNLPGIFDDVDQKVTAPTVIDSSITN